MSDLLQQLQYTNAARAHRLKAAQWVLAHPETFGELLQVCFGNHKELSHKANWVLEFVCLEQLELLFPHFDSFFAKLAAIKEDSSVRPLAHICELICLRYYQEKEEAIQKVFSEKHKEQLVEVCFDWLISHQKVACEARAMTCLFYLGAEKDWIHPELKTLIEQHLPTKSAAYVSRGKKVLQKIRNTTFPNRF